MTINNKPRNTNIEILRFFLMAAICFWHVIVHGYNFKEIGTPNFIFTGNMGLMTFFGTLFSPAVFCFMFISGWYGVRFSIKKYFYLAFLGVACLFLSYVVRYIIGDEIKPFEVISHIFPISCHKWWFLTCYVMVYLVAPFIDCGFEKLPHNTLKQIIYIMTFIEIAGFIRLIPSSGTTLHGLLYVYILARYLKIINFRCRSFKLFICFLLSFFILWVLCYLCSTFSDKYSKLSFILLGYNNPLVIAMSLSFFFLIYNLKPLYSKVINRLFSNVLVIYLMTEGIGETLYRFESYLIEKNLLLGILIVLLSMFICLLIGEMISILFSKLLVVTKTRELFK